MGNLIGGSVIALIVALVAYFALRGDDEVVATPTPVPTVEATATMTPEPTEEPTEEPTATETPEPSATAEPSPTLEAGKSAEPAPIQSVSVEFIDGQNVIVIKAGLPSGCHEPLAQDVSRDGDVFTVTVTNSAPGPDELCTDIFRTYEIQVTIGESLEPGQEYTVLVNGQETTFTAQ
jgi:hypothetical protein